jgi:peptidyl-prolyl cis-trans isomerase A (cyclophilin A)
METSAGKLTIELDADKAPATVANFLAYAKSGFYDGTIFHRVIEGFMIRGGGFEPGMKQKETRAPVRSEAKNGLTNRAGTIAMARTADPDSATAQFFINLADNRSLDYPSPDGAGYTVFGKVIDGFDIVRRIGGMRTTTVDYYRDVPAETVLIKAVRVMPAAAATGSPAN